MARTYRMRKQPHVEARMLRDSPEGLDSLCLTAKVDRHSARGRAILVRLHADCGSRAAPRWLRRVFDHRLRTLNQRMLHRSLDRADFEPRFVARHRHNARWWWNWTH
jgi:hypothetical protein